MSSYWDLLPAGPWPTQPFNPPFDPMQSASWPQGAPAQWDAPAFDATTLGWPTTAPAPLSNAASLASASPWNRAKPGELVAQSGKPDADVDLGPATHRSSNPINRSAPTGPYPVFCQLPSGQIVPYLDMGDGFAMVGSAGSQTDLGAGVGVGNAVSDIAMPTVDKRGGIAGGGRSGQVTSPVSPVLRGMLGGARFKPLRSIMDTASIGGAVGRVLPFVGAGVMALDAAALRKARNDAPICTPVL